MTLPHSRSSPAGGGVGYQDENDVNLRLPYVFGSSRPRDLSYLDFLPVKLRVYNTRLRTIRSKEEPTLRDYLRELRSALSAGSPNRRIRDRSVDSASKYYVFGSSTPRDLSYLERLPWEYRIYDVKLGWRPSKSDRRSKTTSFSSSGSAGNSRQSGRARASSLNLLRSPSPDRKPERGRQRARGAHGRAATTSPTKPKRHTSGDKSKYAKQKVSPGKPRAPPAASNADGMENVPLISPNADQSPATVACPTSTTTFQPSPVASDEFIVVPTVGSVKLNTEIGQEFTTQPDLPEHYQLRDEIRASPVATEIPLEPDQMEMGMEGDHPTGIPTHFVQMDDREQTQHQDSPSEREMDEGNNRTPVEMAQMETRPVEPTGIRPFILDTEDQANNNDTQLGIEDSSVSPIHAVPVEEYYVKHETKVKEELEQVDEQPEHPQSESPRPSYSDQEQMEHDNHKTQQEIMEHIQFDLVKEEHADNREHVEHRGDHVDGNGEHVVRQGEHRERHVEFVEQQEEHKEEQGGHEDQHQIHLEQHQEHEEQHQDYLQHEEQRVEHVDRKDENLEEYPFVEKVHVLIKEPDLPDDAIQYEQFEISEEKDYMKDEDSPLASPEEEKEADQVWSPSSQLTDEYAQHEVHTLLYEHETGLIEFGFVQGDDYESDSPHSRASSVVSQ